MVGDYDAGKPWNAIIIFTYGSWKYIWYHWRKLGVKKMSPTLYPNVSAGVSLQRKIHLGAIDVVIGDRDP
ncbi:hypothetical protein BPAE_0149g00180 [Botrytis paeoniae]|uniref:Uncharacterized protein n=1 Tax=Botrytis paeoniae TaxID=278948 RepID=A0A4Z1FES7_9HELO|nr:hypothetical protein BPAE_0149g00180 [Botrytis paeoniae]